MDDHGAHLNEPMHALQDADPTPPTPTFRKRAIAVLRPTLWVKFLFIAFAAMEGVAVAGVLGLVGVGALVVLYVAIRNALREGWKKAPAAVAIIVMGVIFMALFFVHYNGPTCALKGGMVINLGSDGGDFICIGPS
jgi:hypothetical protein